MRTPSVVARAESPHWDFIPVHARVTVAYNDLPVSVEIDEHTDALETLRSAADMMDMLQSCLKVRQH